MPRTLHARITTFAIGLMALAGLCVSRPASASNLILEWTAPGDDSTFGRAAEYDLRWSLRSNQFPTRFFSAKRLPTPLPADPGATEQLIITDLPKDQVIYFALRTRDDRGNWSSISNVLSAQYTTDVDDVPLTLDFSRPSQNPTHGPTEFTLSLPTRQNAVVEALDVMGRRVRMLQSGELPAGRHTIAWDLIDDSGRTARPGVYFVRARLRGDDFVRRVVVVR